MFLSRSVLFLHIESQRQDDTKTKAAGEDVMFILNGKLFEKCIQKTDSVAVETCDKTEFPFHIR